MDYRVAWLLIRPRPHMQSNGLQGFVKVETAAKCLYVFHTVLQVKQ